MCMVLFLLVCFSRNVVPVKRPNSGVKNQRKESPALQHRGAGPGARVQSNVRCRDAQKKAKDEKVRQQTVDFLIVSVYSY